MRPALQTLHQQEEQLQQGLSCSWWHTFFLPVVLLYAPAVPSNTLIAGSKTCRVKGVPETFQL